MIHQMLAPFIHQRWGRRWAGSMRPALERAAAQFSDKLEAESCEVPALGRRFLAISSSFMRNILCQGTISQGAVGFLFFNGLLISRPQ